MSTEANFHDCDLALAVHAVIEEHLPKAKEVDVMARQIAHLQAKLRENRKELALVAAANRRFKYERDAYGDIQRQRDSDLATIQRQGNRITEDAGTIYRLHKQIDEMKAARND